MTNTCIRRGVRKCRRISLVACLAMTALADHDSARAQSVASWLTQPTMTGDWGGLRTKLADEGININLGYIGEFADDVAGGRRQGSDVAEGFGFGAAVDLGKLAGVEGGTFSVSFRQRWGRSTAADYTGNKFNLQEDYGVGQNLRLTELSYDQLLDHDFLDLKVGDYPMGNDFAGDPLLCTFVSGAICGHMQSLPASTNGWSDYPIARWGGRVRINPTPDLYLQTGVFESNPTNVTAPNGLKISLSGSTGVVIPVEAGWTAGLGPENLMGHYKIGAFYDTSDTADVVNTRKYYHGRYGMWVLFDQMVWRFQSGTKRGLSVFGGGTLSDSATSTTPAYVMAGLYAQGPIAERPMDYINLGFISARVNHRLIAAEYQKFAADGITDFGLEEGENDVELGYGFAATPWLLVHQTIQYINNPGAFSYTHIPNAWIFGLETKVTF